MMQCARNNYYTNLHGNRQRKFRSSRGLQQQPNFRPEVVRLELIPAGLDLGAVEAHEHDVHGDHRHDEPAQDQAGLTEGAAQRVLLLLLHVPVWVVLFLLPHLLLLVDERVGLLVPPMEAVLAVDVSHFCLSTFGLKEEMFFNYRTARVAVEKQGIIPSSMNLHQRFSIINTYSTNENSLQINLFNLNILINYS